MDHPLLLGPPGTPGTRFWPQWPEPPGVGAAPHLAVGFHRRLPEVLQAQALAVVDHQHHLNLLAQLGRGTERPGGRMSSGTGEAGAAAKSLLPPVPHHCHPPSWGQAGGRDGAAQSWSLRPHQAGPVHPEPPLKHWCGCWDRDTRTEHGFKGLTGTRVGGDGRDADLAGSRACDSRERLMGSVGMRTGCTEGMARTRAGGASRDGRDRGWWGRGARPGGRPPSGSASHTRAAAARSPGTCS